MVAAKFSSPAHVPVDAARVIFVRCLRLAKTLFYYSGGGGGGVPVRGRAAAPL